MNTDKLYAEALAKEYAPKDTSRLVALRKLDHQARLPATIFAYSFGITAALVAGLGMCLCMRVIGAASPASFVLGILIGLAGFICMGVTYPVYRRLLEKGKQKYAFEILELAKEISQQP